MPNREKSEIKSFIEENWEEMSDPMLFDRMNKLGLEPASVTAITRMRQRLGLVRSTENQRRCLLQYLLKELDGTCKEQ